MHKECTKPNNELKNSQLMVKEPKIATFLKKI